MVMLTKPQSLKPKHRRDRLFNFIPEYEMVQMENVSLYSDLKNVFMLKIFKNYKI